MFEHIVVGCDGTPEGRDAVALGAAIASACGGRLTLVGVFPPAFLPVQGVNERKTLRAQVVRALRRDRDLLAPDAFIHPVADMSVARGLRHFAERSRADLVIAGSSHSAKPGHVKIGRIGRQLLYDAPFGVAVATRGLHERAVRLRTVGVGYDGSPEGQAALELGARLAGAARARLLVRRVVEDRIPVLSARAWMTLGDWSHADMWEGEREKALAEAEAAVSGLGVGAEVSATVGDPGYEMRAFSDALDLIVVGSRRWGPVARLVTGAVGETLVTGSNCSVLIVPRPSLARRRRGAGRAARSAALA